MLLHKWIVDNPQADVTLVVYTKLSGSVNEELARHLHPDLLIVNTRTGERDLHHLDDYVVTTANCGGCVHLARKD